RTPKNNAKCGTAKAALWVCRDVLVRRRDGVHVTQAISQRFHDMRGKVRRLLNKKMKSTPIDFGQPAGVFATALAVRGLSSINAISPISAPCPHRFEHEIAKQDLHFTFQ